jgi:hypothetical protein
MSIEPVPADSSIADIFDLISRGEVQADRSAPIRIPPVLLGAAASIRLRRDSHGHHRRPFQAERCSSATGRRLTCPHVGALVSEMSQSLSSGLLFVMRRSDAGVYTDGIGE